MLRLISLYLVLTGVLIHIVMIFSVLTVRQVYDEPFTSFIERAGTRLASEPSGYRKRAGEMILKPFGLFDKTQPEAPFPPVERWRGQGARQQAYYTPQDYSRNGIPYTSSPASSSPHKSSEQVTVDSPDALLSAVKSVRPGQVITLKPGRYRFTGRSIALTHAGTSRKPIVLRASRLGDVELVFAMLEGFHVLAPYWVFENLIISGDCSSDSACEHAFHVVGKANGFVLRNSMLRDFNAHIKVNGVNSSFPDNGLIENSSFYNRHVRNTANPVNLLNINGVNNWRVRNNLLADFMKSGGDRLSYGAFMKGNGQNGIFEGNLVICRMNLNQTGYTQVGLSFGGGGTGKSFCRDKSCNREHSRGVMRNNIILNCPTDVGIYLNKAADTQVHHNALINTLGIDVRFEATTALITNNIISGRIREREMGTAISRNNRVDIDCIQPGSLWPFSCAIDSFYQAPYAGDLRLKNGADIVGQAVFLDPNLRDFCGNPADSKQIDIGPIQYSNSRSCIPLKRAPG